ncbi:MAG: prepilin peptidase [Candidatus Binataceae bacterium]|nr:prepilin peptidase [Candidatus Binataceae bacterium]
MIDLPRGLGALFAFAIGACIGSFVNVVAYRIPREISIAAPPSYCPHCNQPLPWRANIPIFAYLGLRGRCLMCGGPIAARYFVTEIALASAALALFLTYAPADAAARFVLIAALYTIALIDYDWRVIPNFITFAGIPIGIAAAWLAIPEVGLRSSLIGVAVGAGFLFLTGEAYLLIRGQEGVGMGDVWLLGMVGAFIGWPGVIFTIFTGSILGAIGGLAFAMTGGAPVPPEAVVPEAIAEVTAERRGTRPAATEEGGEASLMQTEVPFGPFLALAASIYTMFQPALAHWYLSQ